MNSSDHLSQQNYDTLIAAIEREECAIFIGAGLSMPIGYPGLQNLLQEMAKEAGNANLQAKEIDNEWASDFQIIKDSLGTERYRETLKKIFDHTKRSLPYNPILINILNIPFCAFVTTNYDPCLEFAARNLSAFPPRNSYSYPNLPISKLTGKNIFHPHGYIDPNNPDSINSIVLSQDEFVEAYEEIQSSSVFFRALFDDLDTLFVGFGWSDLVVLNILERSKQLREIREGIAVKKKYQLSRERSKFAILDKNTYQRDKSGANYIGRLGIIPITYETIGKSHHSLIQIIEEIQFRTAEQTISPIPTVPVDFFEPLGEFHG